VLNHPGLELIFAAANEQRGESARIGGREITFIAPHDAPLGTTALIFSALPHGTSAVWIDAAVAAGAKAVDLSADLRPGNGKRGAPYGLTELAREEVRDADVVANPGCYSTVTLLALAPLVTRGLIEPGSMVVVDAASGVTGAGFTPRHDLLFGEVSEDYRPYAVGNTHLHLSEMRAVLGALGGNADIVFTPHLLPVSRGILATITVTLASPLIDALAPWREQYENEPFIELATVPPTLRDVVRRNVVRIAVMPAAGVRRPTLVILAAIDNLMKGAAGQAVQNANLQLGLAEPMGLPS